MRRIGIVVNPTAGHGRGRSAGAAVVHALADEGNDVQSLTGGDAAQALRNAREAVARGLDALVVVGGDGIVGLGTTAVAGTGVPLGVVGVGNGNDVARSLGLPVRDVEGALRSIRTGLTAGPRQVDAVRVRGIGDRNTSIDVWFAGVLSGGLDAAVNARANTLRWPSGTGRYVRALVREVRRFRPYGYRVTVDGVDRSGPHTLVSVANTPAFGGGMRIAPHARLDDGLLDLVLVGPVCRTELLRVFPRVYRGRHVSHPAVTVIRAREVVLRPEEEGSAPCPPEAFADGERLGALPLRCTVAPGALAVLAPRNASAPRIGAAG